MTAEHCLCLRFVITAQVLEQSQWMWISCVRMQRGLSAGGHGREARPPREYRRTLCG